MDMMDARPGRVSRMEIVESGRRRRFTDEAKLAIVAESYSGLRQVTATAQRHGITRWQLNGWRRAAREGRLVNSSADGFVPALIVPESRVAVAQPALPAPGPPLTTNHGRMKVMSANGRCVIVDRDVDVEALLRIMRGLETLP
jgi:transposase